MHGPYLKQSQTCVYNFGTVRRVREQPVVDGQSVASMTNKVPYVLQLESSPLRLLMIHASSSPAFSLVPRSRDPALPFTHNYEAKYTRTFNFGRKQTYTRIMQCSLAQARLN